MRFARRRERGEDEEERRGEGKEGRGERVEAGVVGVLFVVIFECIGSWFIDD